MAGSKLRNWSLGTFLFSIPGLAACGGKRFTPSLLRNYNILLRYARQQALFTVYCPRLLAAPAKTA